MEHLPLSRQTIALKQKAILSRGGDKSEERLRGFFFTRPLAA